MAPRLLGPCGAALALLVAWLGASLWKSQLVSCLRFVNFRVEVVQLCGIACNAELRRWFAEVYGKAESLSVLDVGGTSGYTRDYVRDLADVENLTYFGSFARTYFGNLNLSMGVPDSALHWECIDTRPKQTGVAGHACTRYPGHSLPHADKSKDVVLFSFVLHHAQDQTIGLLQDAKRVARQYIVVAEDFATSKAEAKALFHHDWNATFRGLTEWRKIFQVLGLAVAHEASIDEACIPGQQNQRRLFVLRA
uniref:Methyltransferase type 11 domain-containing protein n=1 Tax=Alexandrium catenella TaxID=2925 RepID=A0A7S1MC14_ALECA|mmetsp:Transcript_23846/g.64959  ORF Transcript_23846/g.64959 Transcript_23846/m.64959 type:complete len:251 (+) Transcript_23846:68-820(+)